MPAIFPHGQQGFARDRPGRRPRAAEGGPLGLLLPRPRRPGPEAAAAIPDRRPGPGHIAAGRPDPDPAARRRRGRGPLPAHRPTMTCWSTTWPTGAPRASFTGGRDPPQRAGADAPVPRLGNSGRVPPGPRPPSLATSSDGSAEVALGSRSFTATIALPTGLACGRGRRSRPAASRSRRRSEIVRDAAGGPSSASFALSGIPRERPSVPLGLPGPAGRGLRLEGDGRSPATGRSASSGSRLTRRGRRSRS